MQGWGARLNSTGTVVGTDAKRNTVKVQFAVRDKIITKDLPAAGMATRTSVFNVEERQFSKGDRVVFTKNERGIGVQNGSLGTISEINAGQVKVKLDSQKKEVAFSLDEFKNVDHAYAVTIHKSQGATVETSIMFAYVRPVIDGVDKSRIGQVFGVSAEAAEKYNSAMTAADKNYNANVSIGKNNHRAEQSIDVIVDRDGQVKKVVVLKFENASKLIKDDVMRKEMTSAGFTWVPEKSAWVAGIGNEKAEKMMDAHPLKNREYVSESKKELAVPETIKAHSKPTALAVDNDFGKASYNALNVAVTRAQYRAEILTNSFAGLEKAVQSIDKKSSTIYPVRSDAVGKAVEQIGQQIEKTEEKGSGTRNPEIKKESLTDKIANLLEGKFEVSKPAGKSLGDKIRELAEGGGKYEHERSPESIQPRRELVRQAEIER